MKFTLQYTYTSKPPTVPMVAVKLIETPDGVPLPMRGVVDSGALPTVLPERLMPALGIPRELCQEAPELDGGISSEKVPTLRWEPGIQVEIANTFRLRLAPVHFGGNYEHVVLGQWAFFTRFDVTWRRSAGTFDLEAHDDVEILPGAFWMHEPQAA